jgi:hypothetical protein
MSNAHQAGMNQADQAHLTSLSAAAATAAKPVRASLLASQVVVQDQVATINALDRRVVGLAGKVMNLATTLRNTRRDYERRDSIRAGVLGHNRLDRRRNGRHVVALERACTNFDGAMARLAMQAVVSPAVLVSSARAEYVSFRTRVQLVAEDDRMEMLSDYVDHVTDAWGLFLSAQDLVSIAA